MNQWQSLAVESIRNLKPYPPGKPIDDLERELGIRDCIKLASNENPLGPSPLVLSALRDNLPSLGLYPDGSAHRLRTKLAARLGVEPNQITLGNGSNDILELIARVFLRPGVSAMYSEYAFMIYPLAVEAAGAEPLVVPAIHWGHDLKAMAKRLAADTRVVFLANPNNPTGTYFTQVELCEFLDSVPATTIVVLDEAYTEYVNDPLYPSGVALLPHYPNVIVTRTFSKAYGLAGLRIGYSVSVPELAELLNRLRQPFNVNSLAQWAAEVALDDVGHVEKTAQLNRSGLAQLASGLAQLGLDPVPSVANFVMVKVHEHDAGEVYQRLLRQGVITRPLAGYGLPAYLRISIGTPDQNQRLLQALKDSLSFNR